MAADGSSMEMHLCQNVVNGILPWTGYIDRKRFVALKLIYLNAYMSFQMYV